MPSRNPDRPTPPSGRELVVGTLSLLTVVVTTWGYAGRAAWAPATFTTLSCLTAMAALALSHRELRTLKLAPFLPFLIFGAFVAISLLNPSHTPAAGRPGVWLERDDWIKWLPTTVDRSTTLQKILPWTSAFLLTGALQITTFSYRSSRLLWGGLVAHGALVALVGIYFHVTTPYEILGLIRDRHGYHFSSFVYRNHWAAMVILLVPLSLGFSFSALRRWRQNRGHFDAILAGFGIALLLALTLPIPGTRSGIIVVSGILIFALIKLTLVIARSRGTLDGMNKWVRILSLSAFFSAVLISGLALSKGSWAQHWERTKRQIHGLSSGQSDIRVQFTRDTLRMAADRPVWGWGVGSLGIVFPLYQGNYLRDKNGQINARVIHSHNDWAQITAETGVIGLLLFAGFIFVVIRRGIRSQSVLERWLTGGMVILLFYALVEFPLHNPAVLLTMAVLWSTVGRPKKINFTAS